MNTVKRNLSRFLSVLLLVVTVACVPRAALKDFSGNRTPNTSIVFGKCIFLSSDNKKINDSFNDTKYIIVQKPNSTDADSYDVSKEGYFFWDLPPGEYNILGFKSRMQTGVIPIRLKFEVKPGDNNIYIGNFSLDFCNRLYHFSINNDFENNLNVLSEKFPDLTGESIVSLAAEDNEIGSFKKKKSICDPEWGVKCDNDFLGLKIFGVVPVTPRVSASKFILLENDPPTFEWKPSTNSNVSYDLIIYEAPAYAGSDMAQARIPGKVFFYEENIPTTKFSLPKKLNRKSKYYWSLRLRDNDTVSNWTRFDYFYFFVIGSSFASNQMFSFATAE